MLLRAGKSNNLSSKFCPSPFQVVQMIGGEVTGKNDAGLEFKHNAAYMKNYHAQEGPSGSALREWGK